MPIRVTCSACGKQGKAHDDKAGGRVQCPRCGAAVDVPGPRVTPSGGGGRETPYPYGADADIRSPPRARGPRRGSADPFADTTTWGEPRQAVFRSAMTPAGFWLRFVAWIIDQVVVFIASSCLGGCVGAVIGFFIGATRGAEPDALEDIGVVANIMGIVIGTLIAWLYYALLESSERQATLGKMLMGLAVTDLQGDRVTFLRATGRHWAKLISALTLMIGYVMAGVTRDKQALHDTIAGCYVVRR